MPMPIFAEVSKLGEDEFCVVGCDGGVEAAVCVVKDAPDGTAVAEEEGGDELSY